MKVKNIFKKAAIIAASAVIVLGSAAAPIKAEAKGTAFINKKVSNATPTIRYTDGRGER